MKNLLTVFAAVLISTGCQKQARDILRPVEVAPKATKETKFFNEAEKQIAPKHEKGVVTFKLKNNSSLNKVAGKATPEHVFTKTMEMVNDRGYFKVKVQDEVKALSELKSNPSVEWASLNYTEVTQTIPGDPYWSDQSLWGLEHINMPQVWNSGNFGNKNVVVGVIDEGIFSHDDLCRNIWKNPHELDNGIDDDGNGYIDDFHGWNWFDGNNQIYMGSDDHGTHVAGTIGGVGGNNIGVVGVNSNVTLISCKFLNGYGFDDDAVKAIDYLIDLKTRHGINIKVASNSWGGGGYNPALVEAIDRAKNADILFVAAAGNANNNNDVNPSPSYPSAYPNENIIAVGASDWQNNKASFSSYGKTTVDLFAPGTGIVSTVPSSQHTSAYAFYSGTSMATPHVSGAAALYAGIHTEANWLQIKNALLNSVQALPQLNQYCATGGLLNIANILGQTPENQEPFYPCPEITPDQNPPSVPIFEIYEVGWDPTPGPFYGGYVAMRWTTSVDPEGQEVHYIVTKDDLDYFAVYGTGNAIVFAGFQDTTQPQIWKVRGVDTWGNQSNYSNPDTADWSNPPAQDVNPPTVPQNFDIYEKGHDSVLGRWCRMTWNFSTDPEGSPINYNIWMVKNSEVPKKIATTNSNLIRVFDLDAANYTFWVTAQDASVNISAASNSDTVSFITTPPPPPPVTCNITSSLNAGSQGLNVEVSWTENITGGCTVSSRRVERKSKIKGVVTDWAPVSFNPSNPYNEVVPDAGQYWYRVLIQSSTGQTFMSNEKQIQVKRK